MDPHYDFLQLLTSSLDVQDERVLANIMWAFGNFFGESNQEIRNILFNKSGIIDYLAEICNWKDIPPKIMKLLIWILSNIVRTKPLP